MQPQFGMQGIPPQMMGHPMMGPMAMQGPPMGGPPMGGPGMGPGGRGMPPQMMGGRCVREPPRPHPLCPLD